MNRIGFLGLGLMGQPMAVNLASSGMPLMVWNRTPGKLDAALQAGATAAAEIDELFRACETILLMLATAGAIDSVLGRGTSRFETRVAGRLIINMGTVPPEYSRDLATAIKVAGGRYVEAPVSGSRKPAEERQLVAMVAGEPADIAVARALLQPICRETFDCGPVPGGLRMKLAVNLFMIVMVTGLAEAFHFAEHAGIDPVALCDVLAASPMASSVSRVKAGKLATNDFEPQAAVADVLKNVDFIVEAAATIGVASPLIEVCRQLYGEAAALGQASLDMAAVKTVFSQHRTAASAIFL